MRVESGFFKKKIVVNRCARLSHFSVRINFENCTKMKLAGVFLNEVLRSGARTWYYGFGQGGWNLIRF